MEDPDNTEFTHHPYYICSVCECAKEMHTYFFSCPLLDGEKICCDCCHNDISLDNAIKRLEAIGLTFTREQIDATCEKCGKRSVGEEL